MMSSFVTVVLGEGIWVCCSTGKGWCGVHWQPFQASTPPLYLSALPFTIEYSVLFRFLRPRFPCIVKITARHCKPWQLTEMQFQGGNSCVRLVVYSPDGRKIDSASDDKTVRIWDADRGVQIGRQLQWFQWLCRQFHPYMIDDSSDSSSCVTILSIYGGWLWWFCL